MASVRRKSGSRYWFACFTLADGLRVQRSTKETDRKKAQRLADTFEQTAQRRMTARQAQRVITEIFERVNGDSLPSASIRSYFESWLARKKGETSPSTYVFYRGKTNRFLAWLGDRASRDLFGLTSADLVAFRTSEALRLNPTTVNHEIKVLRMVFEDAKRDGIVSDNPADTVKLMKRTNGTPRRRPFTLPEIKKLLAIADAEWRSLIVFGLYTGQRLGDIARLKLANLDLEHNEIRFCTSKTGRHQIIPLASPLRRHVETFCARRNPVEPIHLRAFASVAKSEKVGTLSRQFYELMANAGLTLPKKHRPTDQSAGRDGRRQQSQISFHSLRHTATSLMKNAGIPSAIVQDIIGHESAAISANYTHIDEEAKRKALSAMPNVFDDADPRTRITNQPNNLN